MNGRLRLAVSGMTLVMLAVSSCRDPGVRTPRRPPRIAFDEAAHDFGRVAAGATVTHPFRFANRGGLDLAVTNVRTGCGVTVSMDGAQPVPPGGTGAVSAAFDTEGTFGKQRKTITVHTNDPMQPVLLLVLTGEVRAEIAARPERLYAGHVSRGQTLASEIELIHGAGTGIEATVATAGPLVTVEAVASGDGRPGTWLRPRVASDAPFGPFDQTIRVRTNRGTELLVPVVGVVTPDLLVSPPRVDFGRVKATSTMVRELLVDNRGRRRVQITRAEWVPPSGHAAVVTVRKGHRYRVRLSLGGDLPDGAQAGIVRLETDHPEEPVIEVPFSVVVGTSQSAHDAGEAPGS